MLLHITFQLKTFRWGPSARLYHRAMGLPQLVVAVEARPTVIQRRCKAGGGFQFQSPRFYFHSLTTSAMLWVKNVAGLTYHLLCRHEGAREDTQRDQSYGGILGDRVPV